MPNRRKGLDAVWTATPIAAAPAHGQRPRGPALRSAFRTECRSRADPGVARDDPSSARAALLDAQAAAARTAATVAAPARVLARELAGPLPRLLPPAAGCARPVRRGGAVPSRTGGANAHDRNPHARAVRARRRSARLAPQHLPRQPVRKPGGRGHRPGRRAPRLRAWPGRLALARRAGAVPVRLELPPGHPRRGGVADLAGRFVAAGLRRRALEEALLPAGAARRGQGNALRRPGPGPR